MFIIHHRTSFRSFSYKINVEHLLSCTEMFKELFISKLFSLISLLDKLSVEDVFIKARVTNTNSGANLTTTLTMNHTRGIKWASLSKEHTEEGVVV